ncbi:LamG domain-containing protein [Comamonas aquatica]|uniref:phage head spike fiber domain-containing protein n=1 Tax=Comamonas aquatica TaxID=225991 RepID=UPI0024471885|nr:LamG-like jellyroll fold domain-containing protein [Comamonas aquatica]MDH1766498.1 LamG domain-containing protein [Comamonas aquatica]
MTAIANLPDLRPSLLLDFANSGRVDPRIQCTRASSATCFGPDGKLRTVAANVPRIDYDPATGRGLGLLVEEQRTNLFVYSADLTNPAWSKTNLSVDGSKAVVGGLDFTKLFEVVTAQSVGKNVRRMFPAAYPAGTSLSIKWYFVESPRRFCTVLLLGNWLGVASIALDTKTGAFAVKSDALSGWSWTVKRHLTGVVEVVATNPSLPAEYPTGSYLDVRPSAASSLEAVAAVGDSYTGDENFYLYVGPVQLEVGAFPTSYIPTGASAVTRGADLATLSLANAPGSFNPTEGAVHAKYLLGAKSSSVGVVYVHRAASPSADNLGMRYASGRHAQYMVNSGGVGQVNVAPSGYSNPGYYSRAITYQDNSFNQAINGQLPTPRVTSGSTSPGLDTISFGSENSGNQLCGHIQQVAIYGRALTDAQLQRITA